MRMNMHPSHELTISISHSIFYSTDAPIPAFEVAEALLALDRIVGRLPLTMKALAPGHAIKGASLYVEKIETGSLAEDIVVRLFFGSKRKMNRTLNHWRKTLGLDLTKGSIVKFLLISLVATGVWWAIHQSNASDPAQPIDISIVNIAAQESGLTGDQIAKIIASLVPAKDRLASDVVDFVKPARRDPKASITIDADSGFTLSASTIAQIPTSIEKNKDEVSEIHEHTKLSLRALDLDSLDKGWAAVASKLVPDRLRLELEQGVDPLALFGKTEITGTVELVKRRGSKGTMEPKILRLLSIDAAPR